MRKIFPENIVALHGYPDFCAVVFCFGSPCIWKMVVCMVV